VNCGALPDTLLESELFGYERGAFTGARARKPGRFQQADGGTLFLDEVGELSPAFQVKLLRALQEGEVQPLGSTETARVDVRIIAATNRDLRRLMEEEKLRGDLYYRLCVIPIHIPPLRERREDILPMVEHYMSRLTARTSKEIREISPAALKALYDYDFPGNVRELINILERAFVLCHGDQIDLVHLPPEVVLARGSRATRQADGHDSARALSSPPMPGSGAPSYRSESDPARREVHRLLDVLDAHGWNRGATAKALGISRSTLWRRMKEYGLLEVGSSAGGRERHKMVLQGLDQDS